MVTTVDANPNDLKLTIEASFDGVGWDAMVTAPERLNSPIYVNRPTLLEAVTLVLTDPGLSALIENERQQFLQRYQSGIANQPEK